ncbi:MAG: lipid A deacylase LpxR family protein, partial [Planctomycetes bacterium]|nr:lipid A deacylase LpxR family protein [Planctomycetota bacterium]
MEKSATIAILFICLLFIYSTSRVAADNVLSVYGENDSRLVKPNGKTDRHYTHGGKVVFLTQPDWQWLADFAEWDVAEAGQTVDTAVGFFIGQHIYTPDNISRPARRKPKEMSFAGWLYTGMFAQRATDHQLDHMELSIGVIGSSSQADNIQATIHQWLHSNDPTGWDDQINDELAVDVTYVRKQRLLDGWFKPTSKTDAIAEYGFTAGSVHRHLQMGLTF